MQVYKIKYLLIISSMTFVCGTGFGQFKNVTVQPVSGDEALVASISINPRDLKNMVLVGSSQSIFYSNDSGISWTKAAAPIPKEALNPALAVGNKGDFFSFFSSSGKIHCFASHDGGRTWVEEGSVSVDPNKVNRKLEAGVDEKGNLYLTAVQFDAYPSQDKACTSRVLFSRSSSGKKWSLPVQLAQSQGNCEDGDDTPSASALQISHDGKVFSSWSFQGRLYLDRSFDGGSMWLSNDISVGSHPGGKDFKIPGVDHYEGMPRLLVDRSKSQYYGSLYIAWEDQRNGSDDTDIWFIRSSNFGDNWTVPLRINDDEPGSQQYASALSMDYSTGILYMAYLDRRDHDGNETDTYVAFSMDGGSSFKSVKVNDASFLPTSNAGRALSLAVSKGVISVAWTRMEGSAPVFSTVTMKHDDLAKAVK